METIDKIIFSVVLLLIVGVIGVAITAPPPTASNGDPLVIETVWEIGEWGKYRIVGENTTCYSNANGLWCERGQE